MDFAFSAMALAASLEKEVNEASELDGSLLEQVFKLQDNSCKAHTLCVLLFLYSAYRYFWPCVLDTYVGL